jgi:hypothetical protein
LPGSVLDNVLIDQITDIIVDTTNPAALDAILRRFGAFVCQIDAHKGSYLKRDGGYVVRCFGNVESVEAIIRNRGGAKLLKRLPEL